MEAGSHLDPSHLHHDLADAQIYGNMAFLRQHYGFRLRAGQDSCKADLDELLGKSQPRRSCNRACATRTLGPVRELAYGSRNGEGCDDDQNVKSLLNHIIERCGKQF